MTDDPAKERVLTVRPGLRPGYVEVHYSQGKPDKEECSELKAAGFRFSSQRRAWWGLIADLPARYHAVAREAGLMGPCGPGEMP